MKKLSIPQLFLWAVLAAAGAALGQAVLVASGNSPLLITPWMALVFLAFALYLLVAGLQVRKYKRGEQNNLSALGAARVAILARVCASLGSVFFGLLVGLMVVGLTRLWAPAMASAALGAGIAAVGAIVLTVIALMVERWCLDQGDSDESKQSQNSKGSRSGKSVAGTAVRRKKGF